jgi:hypothetical protein|mmetsp:Transcript_3500/g.7899  ORF Transcript_3500/g.7899 Transcript_3500/m.7899 type:complete len:345 (-) Transcript_3500:225-1259(-)|eukprot:CAMPEP_0119353282 /NCGR_PEP_ID=MMETSP1334-20130426/2481_1 /TAXON_ID=127549 /ORGANISM="Calcidiscus leptoporus, Strain RCC1130" /LENGTH=344 /DNA_ID=CAMNT_0007366537 /DNA_START=124 /DNA_END=1158 /DNA_ORIENTATION=+
MSSRPKKQKSSSSGSEVEKSVKACLQVLKALQRSPAAFPFLEPVDWKALKLPTYPKMIKQPMDLGTVEMRLTSAKYATVADFIEQVNLIWDNAHAFNQDGSDIYDLATQLRRDFELRMRTGPAADSALRGGSKASAAPSSNSGLTQEDVQSCKSILKELKRKPDTEAFLQPVDWKLLGIPDYPTIIKRPMDLGTVNQQLDAAHYTSLQQVAADVDLVWTNAMTYNMDGSPIHAAAAKLKAFAEGKFASLLSAAGASVESEDAPTELTFEMKHQLNQNASLLSSKDLFGMVGIVEANCKKALDQSNPSEVEIDIDTLDLQTFLKVEKYVQDCLRATKQSGALFRS